MSSGPKRAGEFAVDADYDTQLRELNEWLAGVEEEVTAGLEAPRLPAVFVVGPPRSGSTLFCQVLAATDGFAYVDNLLARFYGNLAVGSRVVRLLRPLIPQPDPSFASRLGKTDRWHEPNEFGFFWGAHFPLDAHHEIDESRGDDIRAERFLKQLAALEAAFGKPVFLKAMIMNFNLALLHRLLPTAVFVRLRRDPMSLILSLAASRKRYFGTMDTWWSCKPRNWRELAQLPDPWEQIAAQLAAIDQALDRGLAGVPDEQQITIDYASWCQAPHETVGRLVEVLAAAGHRPSVGFDFPTAFTPAARTPEDPTLSRHLSELIDRYELGAGKDV